MTGLFRLNGVITHAGRWASAKKCTGGRDTANMFFNKHSFCENIPTLTNDHLSPTQLFTQLNSYCCQRFAVAGTS